MTPDTRLVAESERQDQENLGLKRGTHPVWGDPFLRFMRDLSFAGSLHAAQRLLDHPFQMRVPAYGHT